MKIIFLCDAFLPHAGGSRVYYYNLYKELAQEFGHDVTVLTKKVEGWREFDAAHAAPGFRIVRRFKPLKNWRVTEWPKIAPPLAETLIRVARQKPDLLHCGDLYPQGAICWLLKQKLGIPYVTYCHGEEITQTGMRKYQPRARNAIYREAQAVVAANEFARQKLLDIGVSEERIWKIHPGVDAGRFRPAPRDPELMEKHGLDGKKVLLTVGRLVPRKGHLAVMEALARLLPDLPDTVYLIAGKGPEQQRLQQAAERLGISHAVRFAGYVPEERLADYYNLADIFVMPTSVEEATGDVEGFGMVFLEANACGKPVVAGRSGGTFDSVSDGVTGFLVEPEDVEELRHVLSGLLKDPSLRQRLGHAGCQRVRDTFDWRRSAAQLDALHAGIRCDAAERHALR